MMTTVVQVIKFNERMCRTDGGDRGALYRRIQAVHVPRRKLCPYASSLMIEKSCTGVQQVTKFMIFLDVSKRYMVLIACYAFIKALKRGLYRCASSCALGIIELMQS
jgi:hypothetical protein